MLGNSYIDYRNALETVNLTPLETRREELCLNFARKSEKHHKFHKWFKTRQKSKTRLEKDKYIPVYSNYMRFDRSPISYLTKLLNKDHRL